MIHRVTMLALAALGGTLLLAAQASPWMRVPVDLVRDATGAVHCLSEQPGVTAAFRCVCLVVGTVLAGGHVWHRRTSDRKAWVAGMLLGLLAMYPFAAMSIDATLSAEAAWLNIQHENLVWLGGDLHTNLEAGRTSWKEQIYLVDTPRQVSVIQMPTSSLGAFRFGRLMNWVETFGYSNRFFQFVGRGWVMAIVGGMALACAECMPGGELCRRRATKTILAAAAVLGTLLVAGTTALLLSSSSLDRARGAIARGLYDEGEERLGWASCCLPALREDTAFVAQTGLLAHRRGARSTPEGRLFQAKLLECQGRHAQAVHLYERLVDDATPRSAVRREALRAMLRAGIHALNSHRTEVAVALLEKVLRVEPCNIKANYSLQIAYLRSGRRDDLNRLVKNLAAVYRCFQMPTKAIVLANSYENCLLAASEGYCTLSGHREYDVSRLVSYAAKGKRP